MRRLALLVTLGSAATIAVVLAVGCGGGGQARTYRIVFDNAFGLTAGGDLRVGGVRAGTTNSFDVVKAPDGRPEAVVEAKITQSGFGDFRQDASCEIRPQSLIGEYYVDCQPGTSSRKLRNGGTVPVTRTSSTVPLDLVQDIMRAPYRDRLRILLTELGTGLAGRSQDLAAVLRRAHPGLRETDRVLRILAAQNRQLRSFLVHADTVVGQLERNKSEVVRWVREAGRTSAITATRDAELSRSIRRLPGFLGQLRPTMAALGDLADQQIPLLTDLRRGAPALTTFVRRLGPFATSARPALRSLGKTAVVGTLAVRHGQEEVATLRRLAAQAPQTGSAPDEQGFARPLRQLLAALDDRRRAPIALAGAPASGPPAPDPTTVPAGRTAGFTTFEDLWNYFFWQTLAINGFNPPGSSLAGGPGHILRVSAIVGACTSWQTGPLTPESKKTFDECNQWLGPNQPGVTTPDPTRPGSSAAAAARAAAPPSRRGEARPEGGAPAGPLPGQADRSQPEQVLPPETRRLLSSLPRLGPPAQPAAAAPLLDYLLGP